MTELLVYSPGLDDTSFLLQGKCPTYYGDKLGATLGHCSYSPQVSIFSNIDIVNMATFAQDVGQSSQVFQT